MQLQQLAAAFIVFKPKNNEAKFDTIYDYCSPHYTRRTKHYGSGSKAATAEEKELQP